MIVYRSPHETRSQWLKRVERSRIDAKRLERPRMIRDGYKAMWLLATHDMTGEQRQGAVILAGRAFVHTVLWTLIVQVMWSFGYLAWLGLGSGFARADEIEEKIAAEVKAAVKPVNDRLTQIEAAQQTAVAEQARTARQVRTGLKLQLQQRIRDLTTEKCGTTSAVTRRRLEAEIADLQSQHEDVTRVDGMAMSYPEPRC